MCATYSYWKMQSLPRCRLRQVREGWLCSSTLNQHGISMETTPCTDLTRIATLCTQPWVETSFFFSFWKRETVWEKDDLMSEIFPGPHTAQVQMSAQEGGAHGSLGDDAWTFQWSLPWKQVFPASRKQPAVCLWLSCCLITRLRNPPWCHAEQSPDSLTGPCRW